MILPMLILLQGAAPAEPPTQDRASLDLPPAWHPSACPASAGGDDIVVCGKRDGAERYRVHPLPERYAPVGGPGIGVDLGKGLRGNLYAAQGRTNDKGIMFTVTMPF